MIAHLDLDAFFAAVEQLDRPELRGKAVVVGGDPRGRGVVSTASYEARRFGIRSAMSAAEAYRRCPGAIFVRPDMARYRERSREVWSIVGSLVERFEQVGIDEGYLDLTGLVREPSDARALLGALQAAVRDATGLSCSLGCGTGKTVAKIASDHRKPGGIFVVAPGREAAFLAPLPLRALPGIGPRGEQRLLAAGLGAIGDLAELDDDALSALAMGKVGRDLRQRARGIDPRPVVVEASDPVTIGEETTFDHDLIDPFAMAAELAPIAENVFARVERHGFAARTVTTKLRYSDFAIVTRSRTLPSPVATARGAQQPGGRAAREGARRSSRARAAARRLRGQARARGAARASARRLSGAVRQRRSRPRCARRDARATGSTRSRASRRAGTAGPCA